MAVVISKSIKGMLARALYIGKKVIKDLQNE
jgi:hypothetical protein